jgi:hypothetical protein
MYSRRAVAATAGVAATLLVTACGASGSKDAGAGVTAPTVQATSHSSAVTSDPSTATVTTAPPATTSSSASATGTTSPTATTVVAGWPPALGEPQHGDPVWAVYLAVGHSAADPVVDQAVRDAATVGYQAVVGDIACDEGAMQALRLDQYDYWSGATLYFANESDARSFAAAFSAKVHPPRGVASVDVGCLD